MNETNKQHRSLKVIALILMILLIAGGIAVLITGMMQFTKPQPEAAPAADFEPVLEIAPEPKPQPEEPEAPEEESEPEPQKVYESAQVTEDTKELNLQVYSESALLIDVETNTVLAQKNPDARIYPASMTKVLTVLVAAEQIEDWDEPVPMTQALINSVYTEDLTMAGFLDGEPVKPIDLLYGAILPSGAEATLALSNYVAGSEEAFAELMNQKAAALGLTDSHFVDASGEHNAEHYCTMQDMAIIMQAALDNEICREVLMSVEHTSEKTEQNPDGVWMVNKFLSRIAGENLGGAEILAAKTGFTKEAGNCCVSFGTSPQGKQCIAVTANALVFDFTIADQIALYSLYAD